MVILNFFIYPMYLNSLISKDFEQIGSLSEDSTEREYEY